MREGHLSSRPIPVHGNTSNGRTANTGHDRKEGNEINVEDKENLTILIELKNSLNKDNTTNYQTNFIDTSNVDYNHIDAYSDNKEKKKACHPPSFSDIQDDILIENMDAFMEEKENEMRNVECYFIILSDNHYKTGEQPLKDRVHEMYKEIPSFMNTVFFHYTVDVLMGYVFGAGIFICYHGLLDVAAKRYAINRSFSAKNQEYAVSFVDRNVVFNYFIRIIAYLEALDHRLNVSLSYDKEWSSFCPCKPVNSKGLVVKKKNANNEEYYDFSEHFYHSYAGNGKFNLSTLRSIQNIIKHIFGRRRKD
ncbi:sphingomyelin synthase 1, putative [Plasmodium ovale wallikeri]|uniref:Sphingomyelin synthase 1, putative n=1 Tax=Plasmodium ovale wallikeri TaxID=864142 RepID=A0A1A8Z269_PLAOA|nr:sphingomyelin synthase 1, putative [Plasmodium ovale wallikeri]